MASYEPFNRRLNLDKPKFHTFVGQARFEASKDTLDVYNKVLLSHLQAHICVPALLWVDHYQILNYLPQLIVAHQARVIDAGVCQLVTEVLFIASVERMFTSDDLVHCDSERPHVRLRAIPLQAENLGCPVHQGVWHGFSHQDLAKELMGVPGSVELDLAELAEQCCVVALNVN